MVRFLKNIGKNILKKNIIITPLSYSDAPFLAQLHKKCFPIEWNMASFQAFLNEKRYFGFVARKIGYQKSLIGFILIHSLLDEAEIITIAVDEKFRNLSIGNRLLSQTMRSLAEKETKKLFLEVDEHNFAAQALYKKFDFQIIGRRKGYYKNNHEAQQEIKCKRQFSDALIFCYNFPPQKKT